MMLGRLPSYVV